MDSMNTDLLLSALHLMLEHGYNTKNLAFDAGSALIPAAAAAEEFHNDGEDDHSIHQDEHELDPTTAAAVVKDLREAGFTLRPPTAKQVTNNLQLKHR